MIQQSSNSKPASSSQYDSSETSKQHVMRRQQPEKTAANVTLKPKPMYHFFNKQRKNKKHNVSAISTMKRLL